MAPELDLVTDDPGMIVGSQPVGGRPSLGPLGVQSLGVRDGLMGAGDRVSGDPPLGGGGLSGEPCRGFPG
jgi:hypothetical protein